MDRGGSLVPVGGEGEGQLECAQLESDRVWDGEEAWRTPCFRTEQ